MLFLVFIFVINLLVCLLLGQLLGFLLGGLLGGLSGSAITTTAKPNEGIWRASQGATLIALVFLQGFVAIAGIIAPFRLRAFLFGWFIWTLALFLFGVFGAVTASLKHMILRIILFMNGYAPWNYAKFLNYAASCILLQRLGGSYIFIHRSLLEHFTQM